MKRNRGPRNGPTDLYRHFAADGTLLYVGISLNALKRLTEHKRDASWFQDVARVETQRFPNRTQALDAERQAIKSERPLFNIAMNRTTPQEAPQAAETPEWPAVANPHQDPLVGKWGHELKDGTWNRQFRIVGLVPGYYVLQMFEALMGYASNQECWPTERVVACRFYDNPEQWREKAEAESRYLAHRDRQARAA